MRTRTRLIDSHATTLSWPSSNAQNMYCNGSYDSVYNTGSFSATVIDRYNIESITDTLGKGKANPVKHRRFNYALNTGEFYIAHPLYSPKVGVALQLGPRKAIGLYGINNRFNSAMSWDVTAATTVPYGWSITSASGSDEARLKEDVLEKARQLKADILLNLVEANQIWPSIQSLTSCLPEMARNWKKIRKLIRTASGSYLAWKFGVSPILSDMMSVHRYLPRMSADLKKFAASEVRRYSVFGDTKASFTVPNYTYTSGGYVTEKEIWKGYVVHPPRIRYVLAVKPNTKYLTPAMQAADFFMSRFATSPASLAWERIPFSFVADWFVDLRGVLRGLDKMVGFEPYEIVSFTRSMRYHLQTHFQWAYNSPCNGDALFDVPAASAEYKHYERTLVSDLSFRPYLKPRFGKNQAAISAALIAQQLFKVRAK